MALVRLKPYNPRKGQTLRRYTSLKHKIRIRGDRGWHEINEQGKLDFLETVCQNGKTEEENDLLNIESKKAFDIADDREHAVQIEAKANASAGRRERQEVGTIDAPVRASRPGRKTNKSKAKTRTRKSANEKVAEATADELSEKRTAEIEALVESNSSRDLRNKAKGMGIKIPRGSDPEAVAAMIVDKQDEDSDDE